MLELSSTNIVQITLWVLIGFSVITWSIIFYKSWMMWTISRNNRAYAETFWVASDLSAAAALEHGSSALGRIAGVGFHALSDGQGQRSTLELSGDLQSILERSLRQQISKERKALEQGLSILASIGSTHRSWVCSVRSGALCTRYKVLVLQNQPAWMLLLALSVKPWLPPPLALPLRYRRY
jgi:biopolymer transport protein ExbB